MGNWREAPQRPVAQVAELAGPQGLGCFAVMRCNKTEPITPVTPC
jgi:hypothetical protein